MSKLNNFTNELNQDSLTEVRKSVYLTLEENAMVERIQKKHNIKKFNQAIRELIRNYYFQIIEGDRNE